MFTIKLIETKKVDSLVFKSVIPKDPEIKMFDFIEYLDSNH